MRTDIALHEVIEVLKHRLKVDEDYYDTWKANITIACYEEVLKMTDPKEIMNVSSWAERAADRFLKQLMK